MTIFRNRSSWIARSALLAFAVIYPMFISIYVYLPLLIGFAGFMIVLGLQGRGFWYIFIPIVYYINLEVNLSLPMMLLVFSVLLFYLTMYERIRYFKRCPICVRILSIITINLYYLAILLGYDFLFDVTSLQIDHSLLYSIAVDIILVALI